MKVTQAGDKFVLHLGQRERRLLGDVLGLYPRIPPGHQRLSKSGKLPDTKGAQRLLDQALAEQREQNKRQVQTLLQRAEKPGETQPGWRLSLSGTEIEWLLQVLNDVRIGSWIILGSPEENIEAALLNEKTAPDFLAMELSGHLQMQLLEAVEGARE